MRNKLALQLYTVREECQRDFPGLLRELSRMGWSGVQFAGFYDYDPNELKAVLSETGLKAAGLHAGYDAIVSGAEALAASAKLMETPDIVCSSIGAEWRNEEGYRSVRKALNDIAREWQGQGLRFSYHNHAFEFETTVDGMDGLRYLLEPTASNALQAEVDVYWVKKAGQDPLSFIAPYAHRMPIIHLKDMTDDEEQAFAEIGEGVIDFAPILRWGEKSGVEWYVVEQDKCPGDPMVSVEKSWRNLQNILKEA